MSNYKDELQIYERRPHYGFYIYSSSGCGDDCAIRFSHVDFDEKTVELNMSAEEAVKLANVILKVAKNY